VWSVRGHFSNAVQDDEPIEWQVVDGKLVLSVALEGDSGVIHAGLSTSTSKQESTPLISSVSTASTPVSAHSSAPGPSSNTSLPPKQRLATLLNISPDLLDRSDTSLHHCYQHFVAVQEASKKAQGMWDTGTWPDPKKASETELIEIFVSKSVWFASYRKTFPLVHNYPDLKLWLENSSDALSDLDVWGYQVGNYNFKDLSEYLERGGPWEESEEEEVQKKRKGKKKEDDSSRDKRRKVSSPHKK